MLTQREIDHATLPRADVNTVEAVAQAKAEAGDLVLAVAYVVNRSKIQGIGSLLAGGGIRLTASEVQLTVACPSRNTKYCNEGITGLPNRTSDAAHLLGVSSFCETRMNDDVPTVGECRQTTKTVVG
jgi:hypothetical protein